MKRKALGRGLGALIPDSGEAEGPSVEIDIDRIGTNPCQPRLRLDEKGIEELAASIKEHGLLQPVLVRPHGEGYQLVAGERRLAASQRAGLLKIAAVIRDVPDDRLLEFALIENIQREQLNPIEEAQAYSQLLENLGATQEALAARMGKERSTVANSLRLLKLPPAVKTLVADGKLSAGHARALLGSDAPPAEMAKTAALIVEQGWSVRDAEKWAKKRALPPRVPEPPDPDEVAAEQRLGRQLGTKVEIIGGKGARGSGQIRIHFFSQDDLIRIYTILSEKRH
jgi:ParB family transcriptional regulator, chromosome partitioning protein